MQFLVHRRFSRIETILVQQIRYMYQRDWSHVQKPFNEDERINCHFTTKRSDQYLNRRMQETLGTEDVKRIVTSLKEHIKPAQDIFHCFPGNFVGFHYSHTGIILIPYVVAFL